MTGNEGLLGDTCVNAAARRVYTRMLHASWSELSLFVTMKTRLLSGTLMLLLHYSSYGQFGQEQIISPLNPEVRYTHLVDLDGDGDSELLTTSSTTVSLISNISLSWFENLGQGQFGTQNVLRLYGTDDGGPLKVSSADLNNDGNQDVIWIDSNPSSTGVRLVWSRNHGNGVFGNYQVISGGDNLEHTYLALDVDNDNDIDIVSAKENSDEIVWFENDGNGNFNQEHSFFSGLHLSGIKYLAAEDLDDDGDQDLVAASNTGSSSGLTTHKNNGQGGFTNDQVLATSDASYSFVADLDGDGDIDIVTVGGGVLGGGIHWFANDGLGNYGNPISLGISGWPILLAVEDFNGDNHLDMIARDSDEVWWYENDGSTSFGQAQVIENLEGTYPSSIQDLNSDGSIDFIGIGIPYGIGIPQDKVASFFNSGTGTFIFNQEISSSVIHPNSLRVGDLDQDNDQDIMVVSVDHGTLSWFENDGSGNFNAKHVISDPTNGIDPFVENCIQSDLDDDGDLDVVVSDQVDRQVILYRNDGSGSFLQEEVVSFESFEPNSLHIHDLNGDSIQDLIISGYDTIFWAVNDGSAVFGPPQSITTGQNLGGVLLADFNEDGTIDLLRYQSECCSYDVSWRANDGSGNFGSEQPFTQNFYHSSNFGILDVNNDGHEDLVAAYDTISGYYSGDNVFRWYENDGNGNFSGAQTISYTGDNVHVSSSRSLYVKDLNNDGFEDIVFESGDQALGVDRVSFLLNLGDGTFQNLGLITPLSNAGNQVVSFGDLDGDLDLELVIAASETNTIAWYPNLMGGCTDSAACNYDSAFYIFNNGSCCYSACGCTDPNADNYNATATCDNGSCRYSITGHVFFDENQNGFRNMNDASLAVQMVELQPNGVTAVTNSFGEFTFSNLGTGEYSIIPQTNNSYPYTTTPDPYGLELGPTGDTIPVSIGLTNITPNYQIDVDLSGPSSYACDVNVDHSIFFRNMGNVTVDIVIELEIDSLFPGYQLITPVDSVSNNSVFMSYDSLAPGQLAEYEIGLHTPTVSQIGEWLASKARVFAYLDTQQLAYNVGYHNAELACAYDPNDKNVYPIGYEEPRFILNDTILEYTIRFQNTGNATATDVLITDTVDENLDLSSFSLMSYTHNVATTIDNDTRVIEFLFENIMLPDSGTNQEESNGLVSFFIRPAQGLAAGTQLQNTANIYFDNNPPIITNTTLNTIYECTNEIASIDADSMVFCQYQHLELTNTQDYVETYNWTIDGTLISSAAIFDYQMLDIGDFQVVLDVSNPLCEASDSMFITVLESSDTVITQSGYELTASLGVSYQWLLNGIAINGANQQTYLATENGIYTVEVSNINNCVTLSEEIIVVGIGILEPGNHDFILSPNPLVTESKLVFENSGSREIFLYSITGQLVRSFGATDQKEFIIGRENLAPGHYLIRITNEDYSVGEVPLIIQ